MAGGALWTLHAVLIAARPEGCIADACASAGPARPTEDLLRLFLASVALLTAGVLTAGPRERDQRSPALRVAAASFAAGTAALVVGLGVNAVLVGDSPLWWLHDSDSLGRFLPAFGSLAAGLAALRGAWLGRWHGWLLIFAALLSFGFNAQTDRVLLTVPLGLAWVVVGLHRLAPTAGGGRSQPAPPPAASRPDGR